jgi:hypothetical protein
MPPKDDDDPASTKEVVTKKQKQLLNREELNLAAIAEAFDGILIEREIETKGQQSLPGMGKKKKKGPKTVSPTDAKKSLERSMEPPDRKAKYQTNRPVSAKQVQQFDKDITGQAADQRASAGGKPGAGRTGSLRGQTITKGPFKDATPISRSEREILRKFAKSKAVGQNPLRAEPGSGAELTQGRKRSLKASARRAVEKREQAAKTKTYKKEVTRRGSEVLKDVQAQGRREARLRAAQQRGAERGTASRMSAAATRRINKQGSELLKQIQKANRQTGPTGVPKGQLSLPGLGRAFGRGSSARAAAAQQAAIDMQADMASGKTTPGGRPVPQVRQPPTPKKSFSGLVKSIKNVKPPSVGQAVRGAGRLVAPATAAIDIAGRKSQGQSTTQAVAAPAGGWAGASLASKATAKTLAPLLAAPFPGARPLYGLTVAGAGLAGYYGGAAAVDQFFKPKVKPVKDPKVKPVKDPKVEPTPQPEVEPKEKPTQKPNRPGSGLRTPSRTSVGSGKTKTPDKTKSPNNTLAPVLGATVLGTGVAVGNALKGGKKGGGGRLPGFGVPQQPRGKIGRRQNPQ